jgi:uncharacterized protein
MKSLNIEIQHSPIQGNGVFATAPIKKGDTVHFMSGREVSWLKCLFLVLTKQIHIDMPFQISKNAYILLDKLSISANHSCSSCCAIRGKNELVAIKDIEIGEEITYDYSTTVLPSFLVRNWSMECRCGQSNCRKQVRNADYIPESQLLDYFQNNHLPDFIRAYWLKKQPDLFI